MFTCTRWQRDSKARARLGERTGWTSRLPSFPSVPSIPSIPEQQAQLDPAPAGPTGWWDRAMSCVPARAHRCVQRKRLTLSVKNAECSFPHSGEHTAILERIFWVFLNTRSGVWQNAQHKVPVTGPEQQSCPASPATPCPAPSAHPDIFQQDMEFTWWHQSQHTLSCPQKVTGSRSGPASSPRCHQHPLKDESPNHTDPSVASHRSIFLTWRVDIFAFRALKYTDL